MDRELRSRGMKKQTFMQGAAVIAIAHIMIKVIGALYKIPLERMVIGTAGMGIYNQAYIIYSLLFMISTAGLPVAISKMVAEATAVGNEAEADKIFKVSKGLMFVVGIVGSAILFFGAPLFAGLLGGSMVQYAIMAMAPSLFFVAMMSSYRGYYQGRSNMNSSAMSEVMEALGKLIVGIVLSYFVISQFLPAAMEMARASGIESISIGSYGAFINSVSKLVEGISKAGGIIEEPLKSISDGVDNALRFGAAGAIGGVTTGTALGLVYLMIYHTISKRKRGLAGVGRLGGNAGEHTYKVSTTRNIIKRLVKIAIPVTLGVSVFSLTSLVDAATVMNILKWLGYEEIQRLKMNGYLGHAVTMFNVPPTIIAAIAVSIVPAVASALKVGDKRLARETTKSALRITILFALPCAIGLSVLANPILKLAYNDEGYSFLLNAMGLAVAMVSLVQVGNAILQANGKVWTPVVNMAIGGIVKIVINLILVSQPWININGAPIGTVMSYFTVMALNMKDIKKVTGITYEFSDFVLRPIISGIMMGFSTIIAYDFVKRMVGNYIVAMGAAVFVAVVVYLGFMFLLKGIKREDVLLLPKGDKLLLLFQKMHLMQ